MTRYHFDNQSKKKSFSRAKIAVIFFGVIVGIVILFGLGKLIQAISRGPAWLRNSSEQAVVNTASLLSPKRVLIAKINSLETQVQNDQASLVQLQVLQNENDALRTELSYQKDPSQVITASVIAKPSQSLYNSLIIDRGSSDGIVVGQLVTAQGSVGLGTIVSVSSHTATVQLFSGPQFSGNVVLQSQNITVPAIGKGGGNFEIDIPRTITVTTGDILVFPSNPDIAVGTVASVIFDPRDPFQTVLARVPVNIQELRFVEVVK
jgi:cell shape-determining protein MreC